MAEDIKRWPHFVLEGITTTDPFSPPGGGPKKKPTPPRDRQLHGQALLAQLQDLKNQASQATEGAEQEPGLDLQVEFEGFPDVELAFESLARDRSGIELRNVRHEGDKTFATVFVPNGKLAHFESLVHAYLSEKKDAAKRPRDNQRLIDAIQAIRRAGVKALWTDHSALFPKSNDELIWWEVWLAVSEEDKQGIASFGQHAATIGISLAQGVLRFPERAVLLAKGSLAQLESSPLFLNSIAELRRAKETADLFDSMDLAEQQDWVDDLLARVQVTTHGSCPYICLLDTGVNPGHPLLESSVDSADLHTLQSGWGTADTHGHGTRMAGLALYGDLTPLLSSTEVVSLGHRLESVKVIPADGANEGDAQHHGYLTTEAVARPEISNPHRLRVFGMAMTARDRRDRGRPSAWSAAVDRLASDAANQGANPRLIILSAGNIADQYAWMEYPASIDTNSIQDPGQAWNALTVGATTNLVTFSEGSGLSPIAAAGGLSPFTSTSLTWESRWPLKPDVVFEGGNAAKDSLSAVTAQSLSLLTTDHQPHSQLFATACATSAATAIATRMAATILQQYPDLWPETIRGLIVHSARWTTAMQDAYLPAHFPATKTNRLAMIRRCGFGVPEIDRALWTVSNSLTLIVQASLRPFKRDHGKDVSARELHLHDLPWPAETLSDLGDTRVEMRVTLSYFVEPNPSNRGIKSRYRYESHGLRFDVIRPTESRPIFEKRINAAARDSDEEIDGAPEDQDWLIGKQGRARGSIEVDVWRGTAEDLASRNVLAVYPSSGWWKTRPALHQYDRDTRYTLIVTVETPSTTTDLVSEVAAKVPAGISIQTEN